MRYLKQELVLFHCSLSQFCHIFFVPFCIGLENFLAADECGYYGAWPLSGVPFPLFGDLHHS